MSKGKSLPLICIESVIGNSHRIKGTENQDFGDAWIDQDTGHWALAIADGHGSASHPFSKAGSRLAVKAALESVRTSLSKSDLDVVNYKDFASNIYVNILTLWEELVLTDYSDISSRTDTSIEVKSEVLIKYGTTLCFSFGLYDLIVVASIGDSDVFWRNQSGLTRSFDIFSQTSHDVGEATHSLCSKHSLKMLNVTAMQVPQGGTLLFGTDGIKKSLPDETSLSQLLNYYHDLSSNDFSKVKEDLNEQLNELTVNGSGDDCTLAILHIPIDYQVMQKPEHGQTDKYPEATTNSSSSPQARGLSSHQKTSTQKKKISRLKVLITLVITFLTGFLLGWAMKPRPVPTGPYENLPTKRPEVENQRIQAAPISPEVSSPPIQEGESNSPTSKTSNEKMLP